MARTRDHAMRPKPLGLYRSRVQELMAAKGIDLLILTTPANVFYTTGLPVTFSSANPMLFVIGCEAVIMSIIGKNDKQGIVIPYSTVLDAKQHTWVEDIRAYIPSSQIGGIHVVQRGPKDFQLYEGAASAIRAFVRDNGDDFSKVAVEESVPLAHLNVIKSALPSVNFSYDAGEIMCDLRLIKSDAEIQLVKRAVEITEEAIAYTLKGIRVGAREGELWKIFKSSVIGRGGEAWQHTTIASGPYVHFPFHSSAGSHKLKRGDMVRFDVSAVYRGYTADLGRNAILGRPSVEARRLFETLLNAQETAIDHLGPGVKISEVFSLGYGTVLAKYPEYKRGNIGHSIGIEVHESPLISPTAEQELEPNMLVAIEVPHYIEGLAGFQVEDIALITKSGHRDVSTMSKKLYEL